MRKAPLIAAALLFLCPAMAFPGVHAEREYLRAWCAVSGGVAEFVLPDRARVDCLTGTHAVEADFARKWAEAVGQALYYSAETGRSPGILVIIESGRDARHFRRLMSVADAAGITVWVTTPEDLSQKQAAQAGDGGRSGELEDLPENGYD